MKISFESYEEALAFLYKAIDYEKLISYQYNALTFSLDRMARMLESVGNPHKSFPSVHITGTKGKGSTSIMTATILEFAGLRTGLFTSPHLIDMRERIQINRQNVSAHEFVSAMNVLQPYIQHLRDTEPASSPTFFEILTAAAMLHFRESRVEMAVLEVGLGGRLDSTNVVVPQVSVITNIGLDHTAILGNTLSSIAYEKAGIIKQGVPVVSAVEAPEALAVIEKTCREKDARLYLLGKDLWIEEVRAVGKGVACRVKTWRRTYDKIYLPLIGAHQAKNCALAIGALEFVRDRGGVSISEQTIRDALAQVRCPARIEVVGENPWIILDYAHTVDSVKSLKNALLENFTYKKLILVLGFSQDKDVDNILREIVPGGDTILVAMSKNPRAASPEDIQRRIERVCGKQSEIFGNTRDAVLAARQIAAKEDLICITGSVYVAGEAMQALFPRQSRNE